MSYLGLKLQNFVMASVSLSVCMRAAIRASWRHFFYRDVPYVPWVTIIVGTDDKRKLVDSGFQSLKIGRRRKDMHGKTIPQPWNSRNKTAIKVGRSWRCQAHRERMQTGWVAGLAPRHNHRGHDRYELVRTKTVKISVEKRQITDSSSMGEWRKPIRQSRIVDNIAS